MDEIIDLHSDTYFMSEALRQARRAWTQEEVPIGAVIVHLDDDLHVRATWIGGHSA